LGSAEKAELSELRREVKKLRQERDILKAAALNSAGECNGTRSSRMAIPDHACNENPWSAKPATGAVGAMEGGAIAERYCSRFGKPPGSIHTYLSAKGGIAPVERKRSARTLSADEREEVSRGLSAGESIRAIARALGRAPSTVSREVGGC
jgi:transposase-like protein